jgi:predicted ArsR family transcriptional regulator
MAVRQEAVTGQGEVTCPFPLTQDQIADATGLTPVHVNRSLKALMAEGLVTLSARTAQICDWAKFVKRAEFDPTYLQAALGAGDALRIVD